MRLPILLLAVLVGFAAAPAWSDAAEAQKPNIIFVLIDDMGWKDLGCYGSTFYETPHIDKLAAQGVRFTNGYAACPVCSPTRASILTGKYPARLHLTDWIPGNDSPKNKLLRPKFQQFLPLEEVTIARALKPQGYASASIGKWHLGGEAYFPEKHGFDVNIGGTQAGTAPGGHFKFDTPTLKLRDGEYLADRLTEEAEKFIDKNRDKPFFLYLAHYAVHTPHQAKADVIAKYKARIKSGQEQNNPTYAAMVESVDDSVGRIVKKLEEFDKLADRTVIIFFSDNGGLSFTGTKAPPATSNAPLREGKSYLYEGGIRVPLIVRWPGHVKTGSVCDVPVSSVDFYPTFLEITGSKPEPKQAIDGVSLMPLLMQNGELKRPAIYWHYPHYNSNRNKPGGVVRAGDFKLIEFFEDGKLELYNLKDDISEKTDLAAKMPDKVKELHRMLKDWRKAMDAQMMTPNPDYKPAKDK